MNPEHLPTSARLRRSLARRRVREHRHSHPVLEWLYGRLVVTETALGDATRAHPDLARTCNRVFWGNGYAAKLDAVSVMIEAQLAALSEAAGEPLLDCEKPTLLVAHRDALLLRALRRALASRYRVLIATSASDSLRLLAEHAVNVIVTDELLEQPPGGVWLLERAKASFPQVGRILLSEHVPTDAAGAGETIEHWVRSDARIELLFDRIACALDRS